MSDQQLVVKSVLPEVAGTPTSAEIVTSLSQHRPLAPFSKETIEFCSATSRALSRAGRRSPDIQALAFWMRRAELERTKESFQRNDTVGNQSFPRGTVFHIPPANVDTVFVYSWLLSTLVGNRNIVRLSDRIQNETASLILDVLREQLKEFPAIAERSAFVSYERNDEVTGYFSAHCDTRVVWGGDTTVNTIRRLPISPRATELTFPDRYSLAAIKVSAFQDATSDERLELAEKFVSDTYMFDQLGCSSPRAIFWVGAKEEATTSHTEFTGLIQTVIEKRAITTDTAVAISKLAASYRAAIDLDVLEISRPSNELTTVTIDGLPSIGGEFCGGGFFVEASGESLLELIPSLDRGAQTLAYFGFEQSELNEFVIAVNGRAVDRVVPIGSALKFDRVWDGIDLLQALTRRVTIT